MGSTKIATNGYIDFFLTMASKTHLSSPQVIFSDKGSTFFGVFLLILMITLSLTFFVLKYKSRSMLPLKELKVKSSFKKSRLYITQLKSKKFLLLHYPQRLSNNHIKKVKLKEATQ